MLCAALNYTGPIRVKLGCMDVFSDQFRFDVVMVDAYSDDLCRLNEILREKVKFTNKYLIYNPHVTVAYVKKGKGWRHAHNTVFDGREFEIDYIVFSSKNGTKERIVL